jgi:hypothetical protein
MIAVLISTVAPNAVSGSPSPDRMKIGIDVKSWKNTICTGRLASRKSEKRRSRSTSIGRIGERLSAGGRSTFNRSSTSAAAADVAPSIQKSAV